jgi:[ribosomal protein S5]-alanine N-acetyltransferase
MKLQFCVQYWPSVLLEGDIHVGCAGFRLYNAKQRIYEFGVDLRRAFWKKGFAKGSAAAMIGYGFDVLGAKAFFAGITRQTIRLGTYC